MNDLEKQIEEAARGIAEYFVGHIYDHLDIENTVEHLKNSEAIKEYHTKGMYSEEEVLDILKRLKDNCISSHMAQITNVDIFDWFEQNKKK